MRYSWLSLAAVGVLSASAAWAQDISFTLVNDTSFVLTEFYIGASTEAEWGDDLLGDEILEPAAEGVVSIADGLPECLYDVLGVFEDGEMVEHYEVDICELDGGSYSFVEE